jgi:hypothetical protein
MLSATIFIIIAAALGVAALCAMLAVTYVYYLSGSRAIKDDGLAKGTPAPTWLLAASSGEMLRSPPQKSPLQLIVFADHSLKSFPSVVEGLRLLMREAAELEIVILMRRSTELAAPLLAIMGLGDIPVVTGSSALYGRYNVRVMPFAIFVDRGGRVQASSLVNHAWQLETLWQVAQVTSESQPSGIGLRRRHARAGL